MVMRNRQEGSGTPQWWDDLPQSVRNRFTQQLCGGEEPAGIDAGELARETEPTTMVTRVGFLVDLTRFLVLFFCVSVLMLLYLLVALSYVYGS